MKRYQIHYYTIGVIAEAGKIMPSGAAMLGALEVDSEGAPEDLNFQNVAAFAIAGETPDVRYADTMDGPWMSAATSVRPTVKVK